MNRRFILHIVFWVFYMLFFALIEYLWDRATLLNLTQKELIRLALNCSILEMLPKIVFAYYLVYFAVNRLIKKNVKMIFTVLEVLAMFFLCIVINRLITNYLILPYVYHGLIGQAPLFEARRIFIVILYIGLPSGAMLSIKLLRNQLISKDSEKELIKQKLEAELKFLRNQTNPHFLMNTLNNIYALARKKSDSTAEVVMRLSEMLRFMLYESDGQFISLSNEIKLVENYLELEMIRYNNRLSLSFNKQVDSDFYKIAPLLLLPFVENAFKHGISETRFESFVYIDLSVKKGQLTFSIENSKDFSAENNKKNIGLINAKRQLELLYKEYLLDAKENGDAFIVNLAINLNSYVEI
jgi:two-component system, LytTR family, sensor kinase